MSWSIIGDFILIFTEPAFFPLKSVLDKREYVLTNNEQSGLESLFG